MPRPNATSRSAPRKSAMARAELRRPRITTPAITTMTVAERDTLLGARPKVDFQDPLMRHAAMQARGIGLCAFLVTLAAFQRGLKVTFHYERASFDPRFAESRVQGHRGEVFSLGNGMRTHVFSRTLGDRTDRVADLVAEDKHLTKNALRAAGVATPAGIVAECSQKVVIGRFLARSDCQSFVVKPHDGSLSKGVKVDIPAAEVLQFAESRDAGRLVIEEYIAGIECRATVVDGRCVAVSKRDLLAVTGDGRTTVAGLIEKLNSAYRQNPYLEDLTETGDITDHISRQGLSLSSVPGVGEQVQLLNNSRGATHEDVTATISNDVKSEAVRAAATLGLPICGIDLIVSPSRGVVVLELNQRPYIGMHSFPIKGPGQGNAVAEAIVDYYFPETLGAATHPGMAYNFGAIYSALQSSQLAEVSLPVIGPDWSFHRIDESGTSAKAVAKLVRAAAQVAGACITLAPLPQGGVALCLACAPANFRNFLKVLPEPCRRFFASPVKGTSEWA